MKHQATRKEIVYRILHNSSVYVEDLPFSEVKKFLGDANTDETEEVESYNKVDDWSDRIYYKENIDIFI